MTRPNAAARLIDGLYLSPLTNTGSYTMSISVVFKTMFLASRGLKSAISPVSVARVRPWFQVRLVCIMLRCAEIVHVTTSSAMGFEVRSASAINRSSGCSSVDEPLN